MPRVKHEAETAGLAPDVLPLALLLPLRFLIGRLSKRTHRQRQHPAPAFRIKADVAEEKNLYIALLRTVLDFRSWYSDFVLSF